MIGLLLIAGLIMTLGWAMIYKGGLGTGIKASSGPTDTSWATAVYFSGFNLTTLGVGDVAPNSSLYRILTVTQAALGFAFFSMATTYALSVYSTLSSRNAFLQTVYDLSGRTGDAAEMIARQIASGNGSEFSSRLSSFAGQLRELEQTINLYPVLAYFHYHVPSRSLPPALLVMLDSVTLIRSTLDAKQYPDLLQSPALDELSSAAISLVDSLLPFAKVRAFLGNEINEWQDRHLKARDQLSKAGISVRNEIAEGSECYINLRTSWDSKLRGLANEMLYEWGQVSSTAPR